MVAAALPALVTYDRQWPTIAEKLLREAKDKLATLRLTLDMALDEDTYQAAVVVTGATSIQYMKG